MIGFDHIYTSYLSAKNKMKELSKHIEENWLNSLKLIDVNTEEEIYAFSFFVYDDEDDPRRPTVTIGYNTNSNFQNQINRASNEAEAKWNYAFWLQNSILEIGHEEDESGKLLVSNWISELGLNYTDQEGEEDYDSCEKKGEQITEQFTKLLTEIVKNSHISGLTEKPIIIHELEYYDKIKIQNIEANGLERVKEFTKWLDDM